MPKFFLLLKLLVLCISPGLAQTPDNNDTQFWNETTVTFPLIKKKDESGKTTEKLSFFINGNIRFRENMSRFSDERAGFGLVYKHNKYVSFTPSYLYAAQQPAPGRNLYESRLRMAVTFENRWKNFSIDDRNLVEYRFRNSSADSVRYRNRLRFVYPLVKNDKEIVAPFVQEEVFYDFREKAFSRSDLVLGVTRKLSSNVSADFFYQWQANRSGSPKHLNILGVNFKIKID